MELFETNNKASHIIKCIHDKQSVVCPITFHCKRWHVYNGHMVPYYTVTIVYCIVNVGFVGFVSLKKNITLFTVSHHKSLWKHHEVSTSSSSGIIMCGIVIIFISNH